MKLSGLTIALVLVFAVVSAQGGVMAYEGFASSPAGSSTEYTQDDGTGSSGIDEQTAPARTGFAGDWDDEIGTVGSGNSNVYMRVPGSASLSYAGSALSDPGYLELGRAGGSGTVDLGVERSFDYTYTASQETSDIFYTFSIQNNGSAVTQIGFEDAAENRGMTFNLLNDGTLNVTMAGTSATQIEDGTALGAGSLNFFVLQVKDDNAEPNPSYYDTYNLWVNPTINTSGSTATEILGTADYTGVAILRNLGGGSAIPYSSLTVKNMDSADTSSRSQFDEFMITDDLGDIVIPEPATMSLLALGGLAMIRRRRKA